MSEALRPPATKECPQVLEEIEQRFAEAEVKRLGLRPISGGSSNEPEFSHSFEWIERRARFTVMRALLFELQILRMTGIHSLILQLVNDIVRVAMEERDVQRIWRVEELVLRPLRELLDVPESKERWDRVMVNFKQWWREERLRIRQSHRGDE